MATYNNHSKISPQKPSSDHWNNVSIGTAKAHISFNILGKNKRMVCELYIPDNKELYYYLEKSKEKIEMNFDEKLSWQELKDKKASRISISREDFDLYDNSHWNNDFDWFEEKALKVKQSICPFIKIN